MLPVLDCGMPPIVNNTLNVTTNGTEYGAVIEYVCKEGYHFEHNLSSMTTLQCGIDSSDPMHAFWKRPEGLGNCEGK